MRVRSITLSWFRGAAESVQLETGCKSLVAYGANASGKSSFVDAIEYALNDGKIGHLAHEYSGHHLKNAVPNTHKPQGVSAGFTIKFKDNSNFKIEISDDGSRTLSGALPGGGGPWDYRRIVLRQAEVAQFVQGTKGDKYSALVPLLGLQPLEVAAENVRQLGKNLDALTQRQTLRGNIDQTQKKRVEVFGALSDRELFEQISELHAHHCVATQPEKDRAGKCADLVFVISKRISELSEVQRRHIAQKDIANQSIQTHVSAIRAANERLAAEADPLVKERLSVLESAETFLGNIHDESEIECPACGRAVQTEDFRRHVISELEHMRGIRDLNNSRNASVSEFCGVITSLKLSIKKTDLKTWIDDCRTGKLSDSLKYLDDVQTDRLRKHCSESDLAKAEAAVTPLLEAANEASKKLPPEVTQLLSERSQVETAKAVLDAQAVAAQVERADRLISFVSALEAAIRDQIKTRASSVIEGISSDVKMLWALLHPNEQIEDIRLYLAKDSDKAIDIALKFYGKELISPRLTLSEGYRNSLGLCIFLSMAKREQEADRPVILDDVVVSLDRDHRGMIVALLEQEFAGRQVIVLTHDRHWFAELRQRLSPASWEFKTLIPYESPVVGIRCSQNSTTFTDARALLKTRPDIAGNDARKAMDVELPLIAEYLETRLPFRRYDKNERRTAHEFLEQITADAIRGLQIRDGSAFIPYGDAIAKLKEADKLLITWGNSSSHSFDVARIEASTLIDACESALEAFVCASCKKRVWVAKLMGSKSFQCGCGNIRWHSGKS